MSHRGSWREWVNLKWIDLGCKIQDIGFHLFRCPRKIMALHRMLPAGAILTNIKSKPTPTSLRIHPPDCRNEGFDAVRDHIPKCAGFCALCSRLRVLAEVAPQNSSEALQHSKDSWSSPAILPWLCCCGIPIAVVKNNTGRQPSLLFAQMNIKVWLSRNMAG